MALKSRISVSVDESVAAAGQAAVADGRAASLSQWVNDALREQVDRERRLTALGAFLDEYEAEFGAFDDAELEAYERRSRAGAIVVRGPGSPARR